MNKTKIRFILAIYFIFQANVSIGEKTTSVNGCGPGKFLINNGLKEIGEGVLIECCNQHDICYTKCGGKRDCDDKFEKCLKEKCKQLGFIRRKLCSLDIFGMVLAVRNFGKKFYCTHK